MQPNEFSSIEVPAEYAGRVTQEEWDGIRARAITRQRQAIRTMPGTEYRAAKDALLAQTEAARRAADQAAELRRIEARYAKKG